MNSSGSQAFVNQVLIFTLLALCGCGSIGLGTVWMRHEISVAANQSRLLEARIADIDRHIQETDAAIAAEEDPVALAASNERWHLGLVPPVDAQIRRISVDPVKRLEMEHNQAIFGEGIPSIRFSVALRQ